MGLSNRLKERREQLGLTQSEVATLLGITPGAVGNYENGVSTPKADVLFKVFDALKCDANYLFQDEMSKRSPKDNATPLEMERLVKKYRVLDSSGKETVDFILNKEYERCLHPAISGQLDLLKIIQNTVDGKLKDGVKAEDILVDAAHYIDNSTVEDEKHDDSIMNDDKF